MTARSTVVEGIPATAVKSMSSSCTVRWTTTPSPRSGLHVPWTTTSGREAAWPGKRIPWRASALNRAAYAGVVATRTATATRCAIDSDAEGTT